MNMAQAYCEHNKFDINNPNELADCGREVLHSSLIYYFIRAILRGLAVLHEGYVSDSNFAQHNEGDITRPELMNGNMYSLQQLQALYDRLLPPASRFTQGNLTLPVNLCKQTLIWDPIMHTDLHACNIQGHYSIATDKYLDPDTFSP